MSRKYSAWASNQPVVNTDLPMMRLATVVGSEQDQIKHFEKVEAIPHMYINIDAPPPPPAATTKLDARPAIQPVMISRQNSSYFGAPTPTNVPTKVWPIEKPSKNSSAFENTSSTSKRHHKHKHHHHRHHHHDHNDKHHHHHHHHHSRRHRAKSAESIRNRPHQTLISPSKMILANPQYIEQDQLQHQQQQQQQQPMIVYRELANNEGYTVDPNGLATVPYLNDNETTTFVDDQQTPMFVYRDANIQHQPTSLMTEATSQQLFFNPDQETVIQQTDPYMQPSSQIMYCTDHSHQDFHCTAHNNILQHSISPAPTQQQFVCLDNTPTTIQPTIINQIPVFNPLPTNTTTQSIVNVPQTSSLQRAASVMIQQPQVSSAQPLQILQQQTQPVQIVHQAQPLQILQQPTQPVQIIQNPQTQPGQFLQFAPAGPQVIQTIQPQVIQAQPILQTIQMPTQTVAANPQILYQRPYDPVILPVQNQQMTLANPQLVALSQPSYAPARIMPTTTGIQQPGGVNMFRQALLRTVADRTGVPVATAPAAGMQLMQTTTAATTPNLVVAGGAQRSASLPIVPLTPGGILIPFQPGQTPGLKPGPLPRIGGYPTNLRNFNDIRQLMQQRREQLMQNLQQPAAYSRIPSPPLISAAPRPSLPPYRPPYATGNIFSSGPRPVGLSPPSIPGAYTRLPTSGSPYGQPSFAGSVISASSGPYTTLRT